MNLLNKTQIYLIRIAIIFFFKSFIKYVYFVWSLVRKSLHILHVDSKRLIVFFFIIEIFSIIKNIDGGI